MHWSGHATLQCVRRWGDVYSRQKATIDRRGYRNAVAATPQRSGAAKARYYKFLECRCESHTQNVGKFSEAGDPQFKELFEYELMEASNKARQHKWPKAEYFLMKSSDNCFQTEPCLVERFCKKEFSKAELCDVRNRSLPLGVFTCASPEGSLGRESTKVGCTPERTRSRATLP